MTHQDHRMPAPHLFVCARYYHYDMYRKATTQIKPLPPERARYHHSPTLHLYYFTRKANKSRISGNLDPKQALGNKHPKTVFFQPSKLGSIFITPTLGAHPKLRAMSNRRSRGPPPAHAARRRRRRRPEQPALSPPAVLLLGCGRCRFSVGFWQIPRPPLPMQPWTTYRRWSSSAPV